MLFRSIARTLTTPKTIIFNTEVTLFIVKLYFQEVEQIFVNVGLIITNQLLKIPINASREISRQPRLSK